MKAREIKLLQDAVSLAATAHEGQCLNSSDTPYVVHPVRVAGLVMGAFDCTDCEVIAAALLHDTLEKTSLRAEDIASAFGAEVLGLVHALTKDRGADDEAFWKRLEDADWQARLIKMADALDHLDCPVEDLPRRIERAGMALVLASSEETPIRTARKILQEAIREAEVRLAAILELG
jgi:(p)ppGpp synthase/HD superfamily hydrolase